MKIILLIAHLMAIATGTGMSITNYVNIRIAEGEKGERQASLAYLRRSLAPFMDLIIAAMWITGIGLLWILPEDEEPNSWFKLLIVVALFMTFCHIMARLTGRKLTATGDQSLYARLELFVSGVWLSALVGIILAVLAREI